MNYLLIEIKVSDQNNNKTKLGICLLYTSKHMNNVSTRMRDEKFIIVSLMPTVILQAEAVLSQGKPTSHTPCSFYQYSVVLKAEGCSEVVLP